MKVGDLVWSVTRGNLDPRAIKERRLAIIKDIDPDWGINSYTIVLVACGREGRTSRKYLEPRD